MNSFLQKVVLDNTILSYIICFGSILLAVIIKRILSKYMASIAFRLFRKSGWESERSTFITLLLKPIELFLVVAVTLVALDRLDFPRALNIKVHHVSLDSIIESIGNTIFIFSFIWLVLRLIDFIADVLGRKASLTHDLTDNQFVVFFKDFFKAVIVLFGVLLFIRFSLGKDVGALLAGFGIVAGALALAARESLENLIASFIIFFDKPFHMGDLVKVQQITGTVEKIGLRSTRIRTDQKTFVTVPNKQMVDSIMDNLTLRTQRRADARLEISLSTSSNLLQQLVEGARQILQDPVIENRIVFLNDITGNAYVVYIEYYSGPVPIAEFNSLKQRVNLGLVQLIETLGIELAGASNLSQALGSLVKKMPGQQQP